MSRPRRFYYKDAVDLAGSLAKSIAADLNNAKKPFLILPGGSSPKVLIRALAHEKVRWPDVTITTTDERCVPFVDEHSNAGQVQRLFKEEGVNVELFWLQNGEDVSALPWPATVTVLGMGLDGHFASLFPGAEWSETGRVIKAHAPSHPQERLSLGFKTLLDSKRLILLVPDADKGRLCREILEGAHKNMPLARLFKASGDSLEIHGVDLAG